MAIRLLSLAICSRRIGYAVFVGDELADWAVSKKAARTEANARKVLEGWLDNLAPDAVVSEELTETTRKGGRTLGLMRVVAEVLKERGLLHVRIVRERLFKTKYIEAQHLAKRFPALAAWTPVRKKFYHEEPWAVTLFEAVALGLQVLRDPTVHLAKAMG